MKSEHRHELKTNELAEFSQKIQPYVENYGTKVVVGVCAIVILWAGIWYWLRTSAAKESAGWTALASASTPEDYLTVADDYAGTTVGVWARLKAAERQLDQGVRLAFTAREGEQGFVSDLENARENFEKVLQAGNLPQAVHERALFGVARSLESLSGVKPREGDPVSVDDAVQAYEQLLKTFPETIYKELAAKRIESLRSDSSKEFYAWFRQQNPKPEDRPNPMDGLPPGHPGIGGDDGPLFLPEIPDRLKTPESTAPAAPELPRENLAPPFPESGADSTPPATPGGTAPSIPDPQPQGAAPSNTPETNASESNAPSSAGAPSSESPAAPTPKPESPASPGGESTSNSDSPAVPTPTP